jgi:hypothetical protein
MLFADVAHRNGSAFAVGDGDTKDVLAQENSFGMVPESAMPEVWEEGFRLIEPVMYRQVILRLAAELSGTVFRVFPMGEPWLNLVARGCVVFEAIIAFDRDLAGFHVQEHLAESSAVRIFALTHCDPYTLISENTGV